MAAIEEVGVHAQKGRSRQHMQHVAMPTLCSSTATAMEPMRFGARVTSAVTGVDARDLIDRTDSIIASRSAPRRHISMVVTNSRWRSCVP